MLGVPILLVSVPRLLTLTCTTSPGFRYAGGVWPIPTPAGVPVAITSPGWMVWLLEMVEMRVGIENISSERFES